MKRTWFISGHLDLTTAEFEEHYAPRIREAAQKGDRFVVGDAGGCDIMAQQFLFGLDVGQDEPERPDFDVYHMLQRPRNLVKYDPNHTTVTLHGGYKNDEERDAAMTAASVDDIAWVRDRCKCHAWNPLWPRGSFVCKKKRNSGTVKNLERRRTRERAFRIQERKSWPRFVLREDFTDDGHVVIRVLPPESGRFAEPAVPVDPTVLLRLKDVQEKLAAAEADYWNVQGELRRLQVEAETLKDCAEVVRPSDDEE